MLKLATKASLADGRSSHMSVFETGEIVNDFKDLLNEFAVPFDVYQRLEFLFRQALMQSPSTSLEYSHFEELIDFKSKLSSSQIIGLIDESLEHWHLRYSGRDYGFGKIGVYESSAKTEARRAYRLALKHFDEIFARLPSKGLKESWLRELSEKLRFHVVSGSAKTSLLNGKDADYLASYLGIADAIFYPFFVRHFRNRRLTTEKYYEFLALKLSVEAGEFIVPHRPSMRTSDALEISCFTEEPGRLLMLPCGWLDYLSEARAAA